MCNCKDIKMGSYDNQIMVDRPKCMLGRTEGTRSNKICLDKCIAEEVQYLWSLGIRTTGCCCGHNIQEGYIGVIDKDILIMKKVGYKIHFNENDLSDERNFIPKSHYKNSKLNYYDYEDSYKRKEEKKDARIKKCRR